MPSALKDFFLNENMRTEVKAYLIGFLTEKAVEKVFNKEDTSGVAEAKECIDKAFENLETLFPSTTETKEVKNPAR